MTIKGQRVAIPVLELESGEVINVRFDDRQQAILTVNLDDPTATPDGIYYARECELIAFPEWMSKEQTLASLRVYRRDVMAYTSFAAFLATIQNYGDYAGLAWCGMFLGIEKDGYTHS